VLSQFGSDQQAVALVMCVKVLFLRPGHNSHSWYHSTYDESYLSGASIVSVYRQAVYLPLLGWVNVKQGTGSANWLMFRSLTT